MPTQSDQAVDFIVSKTDLHRTQILSASKPSELKAGQVLIRLDKFALTANNITYGAFGDALNYWKFFPAQEGWGHIPVWGYGDVLESKNPAIKQGERFYGYFPMATYLTIDADRVTDGQLIDAAPHRANLPPIYNQYLRVSRDPGHRRETEPLLALFRPLFTTSFLLDHYFRSNEFFGAKQIILSSASSKTAIGLAYLLSKSRQAGLEIIGLTSPKNAGFTKDLGYYDRVVPYREIAKRDRATPAAYVDFSGDATVLASVHNHFGDALKNSCLVGATHWQEARPAQTLPGPKPVFFFAPDQARSCVEAWGAEDFRARTSSALKDFVAAAAKWLRVVEGHGPAALDSAYKKVVSGEAEPAEGYVLSL